MIIYALIIIASLFFLAWNLIDNRKVHFVTTLVATVLFILTTGFAIANFSYHYGMHRVNKPVRSQAVGSLLPFKSLKMIAYRPMGHNRNLQLVIYKRGRHVVHTKPDVEVRNRIVKSVSVKRAHVVTKTSEWTYRNSWDRAWFNLAKKPSVIKTTHVFYVPKAWRVLTAKQTLALKQIIKNRSLQQKRQIDSPRVKMQVKRQAAGYVKAQVAAKASKDPRLTVSQRNRIAKRAAKEFTLRIQQKAENQVALEALRTSETIH